MLELANYRRRELGADEAGEMERRVRWYRPQEKKDKAGDRGVLAEFTGAFSKSLIESNPEMFGASLEAAGLLSGSRNVARWGINLQKWARRLDAGRAPSVPSLRDIDGIEDAARFVMGGLGSGLGSTVPSLAGGAGGALAGSALGPGGTVVGAAAGALLPAAPLNMGEAYTQFKEEKIPAKRAAQAAAAITPALAALDMMGLFKAVGGALTRDAKTSVLRHIAQRVRRGFAAEGLTEGAQSALREAVAAALTDNPDLQTRALNVLDEAVIGGLTGGAISAPAAALSRRQAPKVTDETPDALEPEAPEGAQEAAGAPQAGEGAEAPGTGAAPATPAASPPRRGAFRRRRGCATWRGTGRGA